MFGAHVAHRVPVARQHVEGEGVQGGAGARSGRVGVEAAFAEIAQERLGKDRAGRVARTEEEDVEAVVGQGGRRRGGAERGQQVGTGAAKVKGEVADQRLGPREVDGVKEGPSAPFDRHEAGCSQVRQMVRQGVLLEVQRFGDFGGAGAVRRKAHQQPEDGEAVGMTERGKGCCGEVIHIS